MKIIYLDLDGTIKSDIQALCNHGILHTISESWNSESFNYTFMERPKLKEALDLLSGFTLRLATMGTRSYAIQCLEAMGVKDRFESMICGPEWRRPAQCENFTIVDDRDYLLEWKADRISWSNPWAKVEKILIPSFVGGYDEELLKLANQLKNNV